jgi:hypothetical protein
MGPPKSARGERTVAQDTDTREALCRHRDVQLLERGSEAPATATAIWCSAASWGGRATRSPCQDGSSGNATRRGPRPAVCTCLGTHATIALTEGVPLHGVAGRLGEDPTAVLKTHSHLLPRSDGRAAAVVAGVLSVDKRLTLAPQPVGQSRD